MDRLCCCCCCRPFCNAVFGNVVALDRLLSRGLIFLALCQLREGLVAWTSQLTDVLGWRNVRAKSAR